MIFKQVSVRFSQTVTAEKQQTVSKAAHVPTVFYKRGFSYPVKELKNILFICVKPAGKRYTYSDHSAFMVVLACLAIVTSIGAFMESIE